MEKIIRFNEVEICSESFGNRNNPAILLIMGAAGSMYWWNNEFCDLLASKGYYVIRFDNRDTGKSTCYEPGTSNYKIDDMVDDAAKVLTDYKIDQAHVVGVSLGGVLAQIMALKYENKVISLTLMSTTNFGKAGLPEMEPQIIDYFINSSVDWHNEQSYLNYSVRGLKLQSGTRHEFNEERAIKAAKIEFSRARNLQSSTNHALLTGGDDYYSNFKNIKQPTIIIHGTKDPVIPYPHALALKDDIKQAKLFSFEGMGHELHQKDYLEIASLIVNHIGSIK